MTRLATTISDHAHPKTFSSTFNLCGFVLTHKKKWGYFIDLFWRYGWFKRYCNLFDWEYFGPYLKNKIFPKYEICTGTQNIIHGFLATCQKLNKNNDTIPRKHLDRKTEGQTEGRMEGQSNPIWMDPFRYHQGSKKLVTKDEKINYLVLKPNYHATKWFCGKLPAIKMKKTKVVMKKPVYFRLEQNWDAWVKKYADDVIKLCYIDASYT